MTTKLEEAAREQVAVFLPEILQNVLKSYQGFMSGEISTADAKTFSDHHKAGKTAISHVELLLKLIRLEQIDENHENKDEFLRIMAAARKNLEAYRETCGNSNSDINELV